MQGGHNKCSAVADMGDRLATIDMCRKLRAVSLFGEMGPHLTQYDLDQCLPSYKVVSWSIQPFGKLGALPFRGERAFNILHRIVSYRRRAASCILIAVMLVLGLNLMTCGLVSITGVFIWGQRVYRLSLHYDILTGTPIRRACSPIQRRILFLAMSCR